MLKRRYKKLKSFKQKPRYYWICRLALNKANSGEPTHWMHVSAGDHKRPKEKDGIRVLFLKFYRLRRVFTGWDVDRHRFFVEGRKQNDLKRLRSTRRCRSRFLKDMWERQYGYA